MFWFFPCNKYRWESKSSGKMPYNDVRTRHEEKQAHRCYNTKMLMINTLSNGRVPGRLHRRSPLGEHGVMGGSPVFHYMNDGRLLVFAINHGGSCPNSDVKGLGSGCSCWSQTWHLWLIRLWFWSELENWQHEGGTQDFAYMTYV